MFLFIIVSTSYLMLQLMVTTEDLMYIDETRSVVIDNFTDCLKQDGKDIVIRSFSSMMQYFGLEPILIEPKILHCFLNENQQTLLKKRGYESTRWLGKGHVTNFALILDDSSKLEEDGIFDKFETMGFQSWSVPDPVDNGVQFMSNSHYFFTQNQQIVHAVIMCKREMYLWHPRLGDVPDSLRSNCTQEDFFAKWDSAYERFYPVNFTDEYGVNFLIPSNPSYFLLQLKSSRFLECNKERSKYVDMERIRGNSYKALKHAYIKGLKELKFQLQPNLINVMIFAGTLLGWYRECDIMPYTTDVDFAALASDVENEDFWIKRFKDNPALKLNEIMGLPELAFELNFLIDGSRIDLFFLYENGTSVWASGHRPSKGYFFRYSYPAFQLCSGSLLGYKVKVPCDPEQVIIAEYGPNWTMPVKEWQYESSPKNMGPHIHWSSDEKQRAYKVFS